MLIVGNSENAVDVKIFTIIHSLISEGEKG